MHGAGNSFLVTENFRGELQGEDLGVLALRLCRDCGTDGMIVLGPASGEEDFDMLFFNADGSIGEMCGNGARCVARYAVEHGLSPDKQAISFRAAAGRILARQISRTQYEVRLPDPSVVDLSRPAFDGERELRCAYVELGDPGLPHAVVEVEPSAFDDRDALRRRGRALRHGSAFPKGANVSFVCVTGPSTVRAVTFERGVEDFTLACGTGCGAAALSLYLRGRVSGETITVDMPGGRLSVALRCENGAVHDLFLTGPTEIVGEREF